MRRRKLIQGFASLPAGFGFAGSMAGMTGLQMAFTRQAAAQSFSDYKALVCVLLAGGNDSFNMVVPYDQDQYDAYAAIRTDLALHRSDLLPLSGTHRDRSYALHPGMPAVQNLYDAGDLAVVANVGPLVDYVDAAAVASGAPVPLGIFSHADQIQTWQTAVSNQRIAQGWAGRLADIMQDANPANGISMNISLSGSNVFQSGAVVSPYSIDLTESGAPSLSGYNEQSDYGAFKRRMIDEMLSQTHANLLRQEYVERMRRAIDSQLVFSQALLDAPLITTAFSDNPFSQSLRQVARVIAARSGLATSRQTFFITVGGWDHHDDVLDNQAAMLPAISAGLGEFHQALMELGVANNVTTFTTSDFGRTLTSNGKGSDHGWGGHHLVMGGAVNGGHIFGEYPEISQSSTLDVGRGIYIPTTSVEQYFTDLALWFGLSVGELETVLPNVRTFYTPESYDPNNAQAALGLFAV